MSGDERRWDGPLDERVVEFVYGELSAVDEAAFRKELEKRPDLQAQVADLTALQRNIDAVKMPEPPAEVVADILAYAAGRNRFVRTEKVPKERLTLADIFRWLMQPQVGMAMAALLVVAVGVYMGQSARRPTEPGSAQEVKERMRPTRAVARSEAPPAESALAESAEAVEEEARAGDEAVESKVAKAPAEEVTRQTEQQAATVTVAEKTVAEEPQEQMPVQERIAREAEKSTPTSGLAGEENVANEVGPTALNQDSSGSAGGAELAEEARKVDGKIAVRSLVDSLDRRKRREGAVIDDTLSGGGSEDANFRQGDLGGEALKSAATAAPADAAAGLARDGTFSRDDSTHKQVNIPRKERSKKVALEREAGKKSQDVGARGAAEDPDAARPREFSNLADAEDAPDIGDLSQLQKGGEKNRAEKREWVGNTYNRAVLKETADAPASAGDAAEAAGAAGPPERDNKGPQEPSELAPVKPVASTSVDEAWGVVPTAVPNGALVKPVSVEPESGAEYKTVMKKGKIKMDYGDDAVATDASPMAVQGQPAEGADKQFVEEEEAIAAGKGEEAQQAQAEPVEKKKAESKEEKQKPDQGYACDKYWKELLAFEKAGENEKALKLLLMFRSGPCAGTRSQEAMDMHEAQIYIAVGDRPKARKALKRLQKVPAMEQKAMDMMESIEGDGYTQ